MLASEQLWETFRTPLQQFIQRRVSDPESAEGLVQEVLLRIHTRIATLQHDDRVPP